MNNKKERFEVLLEEMRSNFKLAFEQMSGMQDRFDSQINALRNEFQLEVGKLHLGLGSIKNELRLNTNILSEQIKEIDRKLDVHIAQPAHS